MGCCCSQNAGDADDSVKTPLLSGRNGLVEQHPMYTEPTQLTQSSDESQPHVDTEQHQAGEQVDLLPIIMESVRIYNVDKRLQDYTHEYNKHLGRLSSIVTLIGEVSNTFLENPDQTLNGTFVHIGVLCKDVQSTRITRKCKYCMTIEYNPEHLECSVIFAFDAFNKMNCLIRELVDKGPSLSRTADLLVQDEKSIRKDVLLASLGELGPKCMHTCIDNLHKLKRVPASLIVIDERAKVLYETLKDAARLLVFPNRYHANENGSGTMDNGTNEADNHSSNGSPAEKP